MITVLAGGVGAARYLAGQLLVTPPSDVTAVVNVADDIELHGLHVSPDIDTVVYTLSGAIDPERGWGLADETWNALGELRSLGIDAWFNLGDRDIGTHLFRTTLLRRGHTLSEATARLAAARGLSCRILPVSDQPIETRVTLAEPATAEPAGTARIEPAGTAHVEPAGTARIEPAGTARIEPAGTAHVEPAGTAHVEPAGTGDGAAPASYEAGEEIGFQEYFVRLAHDVSVSSVRFAGIGSARPSPGVLEGIAEADAVVIAPSNPVVSIGPVLAVRGVTEALAARRERNVAVSPIVAGAALKGPADRMLRELGEEASVVGVARRYREVVSALVIDEADAGLAPAVDDAGVRAVVAPTIMSSPQAAAELARRTVAAVSP